MAEYGEHSELSDSSDLGSWLASMGTPESLTNMIPKELRELDISSVFRMLGAVGSGGSVTSEESNQPLNQVEGNDLFIPGENSDRCIQWLPIVRD